MVSAPWGIQGMIIRRHPQRFGAEGVPEGCRGFASVGGKRFPGRGCYSRDQEIQHGSQPCIPVVSVNRPPH